MPFLTLVLIAKIGVTALAVSLPFFVLSKERIAKLSGFAISDPVLLRLYAMAVTALLVGYASGFAPIANGVFPWGIVIMGLVSNGGAALILFATGGWRETPPLAVFFTLIAVSLAASLAMPAAVLVPLW